MAPKKETAAVAAPKARSGSHSTYQAMIMDAILALKDRNGSGRPSLKKYVKSNNNLGAVTEKMFDSLFNKALKAGVDKGVFFQPKGPSGGTKAAKKQPAPKVAPKAEPRKPAAAAPKEKAVTPLKKKKVAAAPLKELVVSKKAAPAPKKAAPKKPDAKPVKKAALKAEEPVAAVLRQTKSGRITKSTAPQTAVATRATPKKRAAVPKKKAAAKSEKKDMKSDE